MRSSLVLVLAVVTIASPVLAEAQSNGINQKVQSLESALESAISRILELETQLQNLRNNSVLTLDGVLSLDASTLTALFKGVNVQIVNGAGQTEAINGQGNLIVGYDEDATEASNKTGSHNLVVGSEHSYSSYGASVLGFHNTSSGPYSNVTGGKDNIADGRHATVSGGLSNRAEGSGFAPGAPTVSGGSHNSALQPGSTAAPTVSGGIHNIATSAGLSSGGSTVSGGSNNLAYGPCSSISGGRENEAGGAGQNTGCASILGGTDNRASGATASVVVGGLQNTASGLSPVAVGGVDNFAGGTVGVVVGGSGNETRSRSVILGGYRQPDPGDYGTVPAIPGATLPF